MANRIDQTTYPLTSCSLAAKLHECSLKTDQTVLVHIAMSKHGWVVAGAEAVIWCTLNILGDTGTLMMPTYGFYQPLNKVRRMSAMFAWTDP